MRRLEEREEWLSRELSDANIANRGLRLENEVLRRRVVELDGLEDRRAVVCHVDVASRTGLEDLVHSFRAESRFDEVAQRERADERRETRVFVFLFCCLIEKMI